VFFVFCFVSLFLFCLFTLLAYVGGSPSCDGNRYGARQLAQEWETEEQLAGVELFVLLDLLGASGSTFFPTHASTGVFPAR
jgi:hypothetical protein